jgi:hypothetical protein
MRRSHLLPSMILFVLVSTILAACSGGREQAIVNTSPDQDPFLVPDSDLAAEIEYDIVTLLPLDGIPSIDNPRFYNVSEADGEYDPEEMVLGVVFEGEARAYSVNMLSSHEIVNDNVSGHPIAVTW